MKIASRTQSNEATLITDSMNANFFYENSSLTISFSLVSVNSNLNVTNFGLAVKSITPTVNYHLNTISNIFLSMENTSKWKFYVDSTNIPEFRVNFKPGTFAIEFEAFKEGYLNSTLSITLNVQTTDQTAPTIDINTPSSGSKFQKFVSVDIEINENIEISLTQILINDISVFSSDSTENSGGKYQHIIESLTIPNVEGILILKVVSEDINHNIEMKSVLIEGDKKGPEVQITSPQPNNGSYYQIIGSTQIVLKWIIENDYSGIKKLELWINNEYKSELDIELNEKTIDLPLTGIGDALTASVVAYDNLDNFNGDNIFIQTLPKDNPYLPLEYNDHIPLPFSGGIDNSFATIFVLGVLFIGIPGLIYLTNENLKHKIFKRSDKKNIKINKR
jgi:hypothetical protein